MKKLLVGMALLMACGCAGNKAKADPKLNDPPADGEATPTLPEGPPVVRSGGAEAPTSETPAEDPEAAGDAVVSRAELDAFLDKGPPYVLTLVTVEPQHGPQGFTGFQIVEVTRGARTFMTPQVRVGDVVTHVNGVRILKPEDLTQAWRSLDKATSIRVDFNRKNEAMHAVWAVK